MTEPLLFRSARSNIPVAADLLQAPTAPSQVLQSAEFGGKINERDQSVEKPGVPEQASRPPLPQLQTLALTLTPLCPQRRPGRASFPPVMRYPRSGARASQACAVFGS